MNEPISPQQQAANKENAKKGGVKTEEGKQVVRFNARKHGILSKLMTEYEEKILDYFMEQLFKEYEPHGFMEHVLVERIAVGYLRLYRSAKAEKECMMASLNPPQDKLGLNVMMEEFVVGGYEPTIGSSTIDNLSRVYLRYETTVENRLYKAMHELERLQRIRKGDNVSAPVAVDVQHQHGFVSQNQQ